MKNQEKESKVLYITHSAELLIWLFVLFIILALFILGFYFKEKSDENDYQIFLDDVDGLIVGSPVRMMGIEVGHVTKIKPTNDEVYVKFVLTNPEVYIPQGTVVTVEFSGMAGSKSLELYLPEDEELADPSTSLLVVMPPKRLHDAVGLLNDMYNKLMTIIYSASSFSNKVNLLNLDFGKGADVEEFLNYSNELIDESQERMSKLGDKLESRQKNGK